MCAAIDATCGGFPPPARFLTAGSLFSPLYFRLGLCGSRFGSCALPEAWDL